MKSLKGRILILLILLNLLINFVNIENAYAVSYAGGNGDVYTPGNGNGTASWYRNPIAFGYRITLMKFSGGMVSGTHSVNYWDPHHMNEIEAAADNATVKENNAIFNKILPKQLQTISNAQTVYLVDSTYSIYNKPDFILNSGKDYNVKFNRGVPCTSSKGGNCITYELQQKLVSEYFSVNNLTATIITEENKKNLGKLARDCGYNKSNNDLENFNYMVNDNEDIVVQLEPLSAVKIVNKDDNSKHYVRVGTSYELSLSGTFSDYALFAGVYANPIIYAQLNGDGISVVSGINLTASKPETINDNLTQNGSLGVSLFRLKDYFVGNCAEDFNANKINILGNRTARLQFLTSNSIPTDYTSSGVSPLSDWGMTVFKDNERNTGAKACGLKSCNETAQYLYTNYYDLNDASKMAFYEQKINELFQKEYDLGHIYNTLKTNIWEDLGMSGPSCGTSPSCAPSKTIDCGDDVIRNLIVADTTSYNCWYTNETAYTGQASYAQTLQAKDSCTDGNRTCTNRPTNCELICRQQVTFEFPGNIKSKVKAGMVFKWGTDSSKSSTLFGTMQVKMTCKIKSTDGNAANCRQQKRKHKTGDKCDHPSEWMDSKTDFTCYGTWSDKDVNTTCKTPSDYDPNSTDETKKTCTEWNTKKQYQCSEIHSFDWKAWEAADGYENNTVNYMPDVANELGIEDNITTDVKVDYTLRYNISDTLKREYVSTGSKNNGAQITCYTGTGNNCTISSGSISNTTQDVIANYKFNYTDVFNWYSSKINGELYDKNNYTSMTSHDDKKEAMYYHIGYSMPTSFKTHSGYYADTLKATVSKVGYQKVGYQNHFDNLLGVGSTFVYSCGVKIHNELYDHECYDSEGNLIDNAPDYCLPGNDPKGLDVVFREIQLIKDKNKIYLAFPGALASNSDLNPREKGRNWGKLTDDEIAKILDPIVYSKEPMYKIKLNTSKIFEIRNYNKKAKNAHKDPYAGMYEYSSANGETSGYIGYICKEESGSKYCASSLLSKLASGSGESRLTGSCMSSNDTHRRANDIAKGLVLNCKNE